MKMFESEKFEKYYKIRINKNSLFIFYFLNFSITELKTLSILNFFLFTETLSHL